MKTLNWKHKGVKTKKKLPKITSILYKIFPELGGSVIQETIILSSFLEAELRGRVIHESWYTRDFTVKADKSTKRRAHRSSCQPKLCHSCQERKQHVCFFIFDISDSQRQNDCSPRSGAAWQDDFLFSISLRGWLVFLPWGWG